MLSYRTDLTAYAIDPVDGPRYSRLLNRALAHEVSKQPERFLGFANIPLRAPEAEPRSRVAVEDLGMVGA